MTARRAPARAEARPWRGKSSGRCTGRTTPKCCGRRIRSATDAEPTKGSRRSLTTPETSLDFRRILERFMDSRHFTAQNHKFLKSFINPTFGFMVLGFISLFYYHFFLLLLRKEQ